MKKLLTALGLALFMTFSLCASDSANASPACYGKFPNPITDFCWSCVFPIKLFGDMTLISDGQEDFDDGDDQPFCYCDNPPKLGIPMSFWEMDMMEDVTATPGCFPLLGGVEMDVGINADAYGEVSDDDAGVDDGTGMGSTAGTRTRTSFMQNNLYINPVMYLTGAILDDSCLDERGFDVPWISIADPIHNDDELSMIITPYAFPFGGLVAIAAISVDAVAATTGFPLSSLFWAAGAYGHMYPLTGNNESHQSMEQTSRLQVTRTLAELHAAGTIWGSFGSDALCGYYPEIIMDKRQYKLQRIYPTSQMKIGGECCDPIGRSPILTQTNTELPLPGWRDFGYAIFQKRDCCSGSSPNATGSSTSTD
ncbi:TraU family protein [Burkholderia gladioli]|uniref:TraU family protein n=1 Tax=Burkholderia gladioli TaxID=28095 RepID=UPI0016419DF5|nr:TraU family protein [Burkholderia gladioli]